MPFSPDPSDPRPVENVIAPRASGHDDETADHDHQDHQDHQADQIASVLDDDVEGTFPSSDPPSSWAGSEPEPVSEEEAAKNRAEDPPV